MQTYPELIEWQTKVIDFNCMMQHIVQFVISKLLFTYKISMKYGIDSISSFIVIIKLSSVNSEPITSYFEEYSNFGNTAITTSLSTLI